MVGDIRTGSVEAGPIPPTTGPRNTGPMQAFTLNEAHPLVRAGRRVETLQMQAAAVALTLLLGVSGWLIALSGAPALTLASAAVLAALLLLLARARAVRSDAALDSIVEGREDRANPAIRAAQRRLSDPVWRDRLARSLEGALERSETWNRTLSWTRTPGDLRHVKLVRDEITEVARLLRAEHVGDIRGVALTERLLTDGWTSPLYGGTPDELRRTLGRIRFVLSR